MEDESGYSGYSGELRPKRRGSDRGLRGMIDNGIGQRVTRLMVIFGFPVVTGLFAYAFTITMENIHLEIDAVRQEIHEIGTAVKDTQGTVRDLSANLTKQQMDIIRLQTQSDDGNMDLVKTRTSHP